MWEEELQGDGARVEALWGKAVEHGMVDSVRALVERSGETLMVAQNTAGETALALALKCGQAEVALLLVETMSSEALLLRDQPAEQAFAAQAFGLRHGAQTAGQQGRGLGAFVEPAGAGQVQPVARQGEVPCGFTRRLRNLDQQHALLDLPQGRLGVDRF